MRKLKTVFLLPWVPIWIVPVLFAMAIGTVWLRLAIIRTTYQISQTDRMIRNLQQDSEQQQLRLSELRSPRKLESIAKIKYRLVQPKAEQMIQMRSLARAK